MSVTRLRPAAIAIAALVVLATGCSGHSAQVPKPVTSAGTATADGLAGGDGEGSASSSATQSATPSTRSPSPARTSAKPVSTAIVETVAGACPYIDTQAAADAEGNRIGEVSVLTRGGVVMGCRFRFQYADNHYTLEITSQKYADATTAYNAMVRQGSAGKNAAGDTLSTGQPGIRYRTAFYTRDGDQDWAFVFVKGVTVVTVKTDQANISQDAVDVAELIAPKF